MNSKLWRAGRVAGLFVAVAAFAATVGCGGGGFDGSGLTTPTSTSRGAMDGFVFVPSRQADLTRQTAEGTVSIPFARIEVYILPRTPGDSPIRTTQAGFDPNTGRFDYYRIDDLEIQVPLLVVATDPFDPDRRLTAVISFEDEGQNKNRNITPTSTIAAEVVESEGLTEPLSDGQVAALETLADQVLNNLPAGTDVTLTSGSNASALASAVQQAAAAAFGTLTVNVFSTPPVTATVTLNGSSLGTVTTATPPASSRQTVTVSGNTLTATKVPIGTANLRIVAPGFVTDQVAVDIVGGQTTTISRTLVTQPVAGQNASPIVVSADALPRTVPFQGGTVNFNAVVRDPNGDTVTGTAQVARTASGGALSQVIANPTLTKSGDTFTGSVTVEGNSTTVTQAYVITLSFTDGPGRPVVNRLLNFTVSPLVGPPPPPAPTDGRRLIGRWIGLRHGPTPDSLVPDQGNPDLLEIRDNGTFQIVSDAGQFSGNVFFVPPSTARATSFNVELEVTQSSGSAQPATGERVPVVATISDDNNSLQTILYPNTARQQVSEWQREGTSVPQ